MHPLREHALQIWRAAVSAADPFSLVRDFVCTPDNPVQQALATGGRILVLGGGKAGAIMASGVESGLHSSLDRVLGVVSVPGGEIPTLAKIHLREARPLGSNHPTQQGVAAVEEQLRLIETLTPADLALCLFSGGGSALLPAPVDGVSLADKQEVTRLLHSCGATIDQMNAVRKHLSRVKGGQLAQRLIARGVQVISLLISDVVGDPLDVIASGPTAPDPTTFADALAVLTHFQLLKKAPTSVVAHLRQGAAGAFSDTPKYLPGSVQNIILASNSGSLLAAAQQAQTLGYQVLNLGSYIEGETQHTAVALTGIFRSIQEQQIPIQLPACILSGGETTVTLSPSSGNGGRNQEFVLSCLVKLGANRLHKAVILSGGTDGEDGPTDAAGAMGDAEILSRAELLRLDPEDHLKRHDAYPFFHATKGLLLTGLTQTNVMDVRVMLLG